MSPIVATVEMVNGQGVTCLSAEGISVAIYPASPEDARPFARVLGKRGAVTIRIDVEPAERTPEVVLRAMLAAHEAAALEIRNQWRRTAGGTPENSAAERRMKQLDHDVVYLRDLTSSEIVQPTMDPYIDRAWVRSDYEARLRGERPLSAPPPEV